MSNWIDVSVLLRNGMPSWPGDRAFERTLDSDMKKGDHDNVSRIATSVHAGTHMDAPVHFVQNGQGIDQIPLEVCIGRARVIPDRACGKGHPGRTRTARHSERRTHSV